MGELPAATIALDQAGRRGDAVASLTMEGVALRYRACLALLQGRCEDALESAVAGAEVLGRAAQEVERSIALSHAALAALRLGQLDRARRRLTQARRCAGVATDACAIADLVEACVDGRGLPTAGAHEPSDLRLARRCALLPSPREDVTPA